MVAPLVCAGDISNMSQAMLGSQEKKYDPTGMGPRYLGIVYDTELVNMEFPTNIWGATKPHLYPKPSRGTSSP